MLEITRLGCQMGKLFNQEVIDKKVDNKGTNIIATDTSKSVHKSTILDGNVGEEKCKNIPHVLSNKKLSE